MKVLTPWTIWIKIVDISSHSVRKQPPVWKYSFCQLQPRLGDILACQVFRVYGRIVRILLSIRTALTPYLASQNMCFWIQECRSRPCCISSANQNYDAFMALVLTFLLDRSWMLSLTSVASRASGWCAPSEWDGDSSYSRFALVDLVRSTAESPWWNFEWTGC